MIQCKGDLWTYPWEVKGELHGATRQLLALVEGQGRHPIVVVTSGRLDQGRGFGHGNLQDVERVLPVDTL